MSTRMAPSQMGSFEDVLVLALHGTHAELCPPRLRAAMRHAVFPGGARVRPRLCVAVGVACGASEDDAVLSSLAAAVELVHCASLVHDDLPCFDDANVRRGKPSVHVAFDEPTAVLVGDALLTLAFDVAARAGEQRAALGTKPVRALLRATGAFGGLVAGQAWESEPDVDVGRYHAAKTAALFEAATTLGAIAGGADPGPFMSLGRALGMAYQLADDVVDRMGAPEQAGKPVGRDAALRRPSAAAGALEDARRALWTSLSSIPRAVPACPGEAQLRDQVGRVCTMLAARCFGDPRHPASDVASPRRMA